MPWVFFFIFASRCLVWYTRGVNRRILVLAGSERDYDKVKEGLEFLKEMDVPFVFDVVSAHRSPERVVDYARQAEQEGFRVIIACAGLSAHLPGVIAAHTTLPVIGVPLSTGPLSGFDALLSIVQMPRGVPVATVGIDSVANACILALEILALTDDEIKERVKLFKARRKESTIRIEYP